MILVLQIIGGVLLFLLIVAALFFLMIPIGSAIAVNRNFKNQKDGVDIYLTTTGMHIDFVVPTQNSIFDWAKVVNCHAFPKPLKDYKYLGIGWGDYGFYLEIETWDDVPLRVGARALFHPSTPTIMHVIGYDKIPEDEGMRVAKVSISQQQYLQLCHFIYRHFVLDKNQNVNLLPNKGYTKDDNFYKAHGSYTALHTCNYWVNKGLKNIGVRTPLWSPMPNGVFKQVEKLEPTQNSKAVKEETEVSVS